METNLLQQAGITGTTLVIILVAYRALKSCRGGTVRSKCCGKSMEIGLDLERQSSEVEMKDNPLVVNGASHLNNPVREQATRPEIEESKV